MSNERSLTSTDFSGTLTAADVKRNIPHAVQVPAGAQVVRIRLDFEPAEVGGFKNHMALTVFDPRGFRGAGHRHGSTHIVELAATRASPGYFPGPLPAGEWSVVIDTHMIMPGETCRYRLNVTCDRSEPEAPPVRQPPSRPAGGTAGPGWYRGDLHAHSRHSDARWDVPDLAAWARAHSLDFCTLTDHSTVSGLPEMLGLGGPDLLTMGGMECTTFWGHALALGRHEWIDWRSRPGHGMPEIAADVTARGGTFIIAHPMAIGDPYCTGCRWAYADFSPGTAHAVEVWNTQWDNGTRNEDSLRLAFDWLNAGGRFALTAGTDNHGTLDAARYGFNVVHAQTLTETAILSAVRQGHLYVSSGPRLVITARSGGASAGMGDALAAGENPVVVHVDLRDAPSGAVLDLIADGASVARRAAGHMREFIWPLPAPGARWCMVTLRDADGLMLALTNPIFVARA